MKTEIIIYTFIILAFLACSTSTGPDVALIFSEMEIHYTKSGGWINTSKLDIMSDGTVNAFEMAHASGETINTSSKFLKDSKKEKLSILFSSFSEYESHYAPEPLHTDGNHHNIILLYEGKADTVTVYEPQNAIMPDRLYKIIQELENIWMNTLDI